MTKDKYFLRSGNLFSMIFQTNLSQSIDAIKIPDAAKNSAIPNNQVQSVFAYTKETTPPHPTATATTLTWSQLEASFLEKQIIKKEKVAKNQTNQVAIGESVGFNINQQRPDPNVAITYTIENARQRYIDITGDNTLAGQDFNFLSNVQSLNLYKIPSQNDEFVEQIYDFNGKKVVVALINKKYSQLWNGQINQEANKAKINKIFEIPENKRNFRRIVKLLATIAVRETGNIGEGRYSGNAALFQLEYSAICWATINMSLRDGFSCGGDIMKLFDTIWTLNDKPEDQKLIKTLQAGETEEALIARENQNILNNPNRTYTSNTQNMELYVMAFFDGLIPEEFPGTTNWQHVQGQGENFPLDERRFGIPKKEAIQKADGTTLEYPRYVDDATGSSTFPPTGVRTSNSRVYTIYDNDKKKYNILISTN